MCYASNEENKIVKIVQVELSDNKVIKSLQESESYRFLEILEAGKYLTEEMKLKRQKSTFLTTEEKVLVKFEWWEFSPKT